MEAQQQQRDDLRVAGRALGYVGFGNIGQDLYKLAQPFEMRHLVYDPYLSDEVAGQHDIERVDFRDLLDQADFIVLLCLLTDETRHLINEAALKRMKKRESAEAVRNPFVHSDSDSDSDDV